MSFQTNDLVTNRLDHPFSPPIKILRDDSSFRATPSCTESFLGHPTWSDVPHHTPAMEENRSTATDACFFIPVALHSEAQCCVITKMQVRQWRDTREDISLDSKSPYWTKIRMVGPDGEPATGIPLKSGYFKIQLPEILFEHDPKSITIRWIDFYRS